LVNKVHRGHVNKANPQNYKWLLSFGSAV